MILPKSARVLARMRRVRMRRLRRLGFPLRGSLVRLPGHRSLYLTDKIGGRTRTLYVPLDQRIAVRRWNANFRLGKQLLTELSEIQRALLRAGRPHK